MPLQNLSNRVLFAGLVMLSAASGAAARRGENSPVVAGDILYQNGMTLYAAGRFPEALAAFQEALRRDPDSRAACVAVSRVRAEMSMSATERTSAVRTSALGQPPPDNTIFERLGRVVDFANEVGDERERLGRARALQGRIAQLLAERRIARVRRRRFAKDAELHALSRQLS